MQVTRAWARRTSAQPVTEPPCGGDGGPPPAGRIGTPGHDNSGATLSGVGEGTPLFNLDDGTHELVDQGTFDVFSVPTFTVTFPNGDHYVVDGTTGLLVP